MVYKRQVNNMINISLLLLMGMRSAAWAQESLEGPVNYKVQAPMAVHAGDQFSIAVIFNVQESWYIYAPTGNNTTQGMIETKASFELPEGITTVGQMQMPKPFFQGPHEVYKGNNIQLTQLLTTSSRLKPGTYEINGRIRYQACSSDVCFPPRTDKINVVIYID